MKKLNLIGNVYGRLTVIKRIDGAPHATWLCRCECGAEVSIRQKELRNGDTKSCGCLRKQLRIRNNLTHGQSKTKTYMKWCNMWQRIRNKTKDRNKCYENINVCDRWKSYELFLKDMGEVPDGYSLDRIDSTKDYSPYNCRWVPLEEQARNTTRNRMVEYKGKLACVAVHARENGLEPDVVFDRLNKLKWDIDRALSIPKRALKELG